MTTKARVKLSVSERLGAAAYLALTGKQATASRLSEPRVVKVGRVPKSMRTAATPDYNDPYRDPTLDEIGGRQSGRPGRVFQRWTYPFRGYSMPLLEIPANRVIRYIQCFEYFTTEDIVNAALNMKISFALANHEAHVEVLSDDIPIWMPLDEIPDQSDMPEESRTPNRVFIAQHIKKKLDDLREKLDLDRWNQNYWLEAAIYGDAFANIVDGLEDVGEMGDNFEEAPALQTLAALVKAGKAKRKDKVRYEQLLEKKTAWARRKKVMLELAAIRKEMTEVEEAYADIYKDAVKNGQLLQDASTKADKKNKDGRIEVTAGAVSMHVGPHLLKKAEAITTKFDGKAEDAFKKLNALAKKRDALLNANAELLGRSYTIDVLQTLNPSAVWETRNDLGEVVRMELVKRIGVDASPLVIGDQIHSRWSGSDYTTYGISDIYPAFRSIKLKRSLEEALAAYGERYSQPIIQVKVGSDDPASQMNAAMETLLADATDLFRSYDRRSVLVTPWHYKIEIIGTDGKPLRLDMYLNYAIERMLTALGVPKTFLWGDGSNYATARTQYQSLINRLKSLQEKSDRMLSTRVYGRFLERRGYRDGSNGKIVVSCTFENNDMDAEETVAKLLSAMAQVAAATANPTLLLSETTLLEMLGRDADIEHQNKLREAAKLMKLKSIGPEQAPAQDPQKTAPLGVAPIGPPLGVSPNPQPGAMAGDVQDALLALASALDGELAKEKKTGGLQSISIAEASARLHLSRLRARVKAGVATAEEIEELKLDDRNAPGAPASPEAVVDDTLPITDKTNKKNPAVN